MCPRKQTTEPKLVILVSFFSWEVTSYTDTSYCIHILWEACRSVFFWATLYNYHRPNQEHIYAIRNILHKYEVLVSIHNCKTGNSNEVFKTRSPQTKTTPKCQASNWVCIWSWTRDQDQDQDQGKKLDPRWVLIHYNYTGTMNEINEFIHTCTRTINSNLEYW